MSIINVHIEQNVDKSIDWLKKLESVISDLQPELNKTTDYLLNFFSDDVFRSEGDVYGESWAPLSPKTDAEKARKYPLAGILRRTGAMQQGFRVMGTNTYALIYNTQDYFAFHQLGTRRIPQRIVMNLDNQRLNTIASIVGQSITSRLLAKL